MQDLQLAGLAEPCFLKLLQGCLVAIQIQFCLPVGSRGVTDGLAKLLMQGLQLSHTDLQSLLLLQLLPAVKQGIQLRLQLAQPLRQVVLVQLKCLKVRQWCGGLGRELLLQG